jgi:hypothetical protein
MAQATNGECGDDGGIANHDLLHSDNKQLSSTMQGEQNAKSTETND